MRLPVSRCSPPMEGPVTIRGTPQLFSKKKKQAQPEEEAPAAEPQKKPRVATQPALKRVRIHRTAARLDFRHAPVVRRDPRPEPFGVGVEAALYQPRRDRPEQRLPTIVGDEIVDRPDQGRQHGARGLGFVAVRLAGEPRDQLHGAQRAVARRVSTAVERMAGTERFGGIQGGGWGGGTSEDCTTGAALARRVRRPWASAISSRRSRGRFVRSPGSVFAARIAPFDVRFGSGSGGTSG